MKHVLGLVAVTIVSGVSGWAVAQTSTDGIRTEAGQSGSRVSVPWRPGNAQGFQMGAAEERRATSAQGHAGPFPFVVLLHGCGGLKHEASWTAWVQPWADLFRKHAIGTAVVDSFGPRGVDQVCTGNVAEWAVSRSDDAYSARAWLGEQPSVDARRIAVMGMSNGGRTVLAALRTTLRHPDPFVAGGAVPGLPDRCRQPFLCAVAGAHRQGRHGGSGPLL